MHKVIPVLTRKVVTSLNEDLHRVRQAIFDHVGYVEGPVKYPINDCTQFFWRLRGLRPTYAMVSTSEDVLRPRDEINEGDYFILKTQPIDPDYRKWVCRGVDYTMILTGMDGSDESKILHLFSNSMRWPTKNA